MPDAAWWRARGWATTEDHLRRAAYGPDPDLPQDRPFLPVREEVDALTAAALERLVGVWIMAGNLAELYRGIDPEQAGPWRELRDDLGAFVRWWATRARDPDEPAVEEVLHSYLRGE